MHFLVLDIFCLICRQRTVMITKCLINWFSSTDEIVCRVEHTIQKQHVGNYYPLSQHQLKVSTQTVDHPFICQ